MPNYFLVKCSIQEQEERMSKVGSIIIPVGHRYMVYNMEYGEIVAVGSRAAQLFPPAKVGMTLIMHHFVQGESDRESEEEHLIGKDDSYKYYLVTCCAFNGKRNETYGVWDGQKIIPHPDFVFLAPEPPRQSADAKDFIDSAVTQTAGGLLVFKEWKETQETLTEKMDKIKNKIQSLSKSGLNRPHIRQQIFYLEEELEKISRQLNTITYEPYEVEYAPEILSSREWFNRPITKGRKLYIQSNAANTVINFRESHYRIAKLDNIGFIME